MFSTTDIDIILLNKFQKVSDWFQDIFGINNFTLAKAMVFISAPALVGQVVYYAFVTQNFLAATFQTLTLIFLGFIANQINIANRIQDGTNSGFLNQAAINLRFVRLIYVLVFCFTLIELPDLIGYFVSKYSDPSEFYRYIYIAMDDVEDTAFLFLVYFMSCTPKPPKKSKLKKALEKAKATAEGFTSSPETAPSLG